ncbi:MAG: DUF4352 domain-containing protein [Synergistaceae bacterium]|nr:DUF4352 domain-containing protein [Synergistaceae bacterium]
MSALKKLRIALIVVAIVVALVPGVIHVISRTSGGEGTLEAIGSYLKGDVMGEIGKRYSTKWFQFTVKSVEKKQEYAGYKADDENILVDVVVTERCTFDETTDMSKDDFYLDAESFPDYIYPVDPLDDSMMPLEFQLEPKEEREYHMLYEIPADTTGLKLVYIELDVEGNIGATFTINVSD